MIPYVDPKISVKENTDREERIIFVGNIGLDVHKKDILKFFKNYGKIEKIWTRSIPTDHTLKSTRRAKAI